MTTGTAKPVSAKDVSWRSAACAVVLVWLVMQGALFRPRLYGRDPVAYYAWLRSAVIDGDLEVSDEFTRLGFMGERERAPTGYTYNEWSVGPALLWAPFFLLAHLGVHVLSLLGGSVPADGYAAPYLWASGLGSALYALIGLLLILRLCRQVADAGGSDVTALWATLAVFLATPLVFYAMAHPFMSHAPDMFLNTLFVTVWLLDDTLQPKRGLVLGFVGGLACAVRLQNATLLLLAVLALIVDALYRRSEIRASWRGVALGTGMLSLGFLVGFSPQLLAWRIVFGQWVVLNPYGVVGIGGLDGRSPHLLQVLFSPNRGLFTWTPLALPAVVGLVPLYRHRPRWSLLLGLNLLLQVYIIGAWSCWHGAAAFGQRFLVNSAPVLALGLAALVASWACGRAERAAVALAVACLAAWNLLLLVRYAVEDVPRMGAVSLEHLWLGQFRFLCELGREFGKVITLLLER
jgi:hypothetical protein